MKQLEREIYELLVPELFLAYHGYNHALSRHLDVSHQELKERMKKKNFHKGELITLSRFSQDKTLKDVCEIIHECLVNNLKEIECWIKHNHQYSKDFLYEFDAPIGDGIAMGTNWRELFPMSRVCVVLEESYIKGRFFHILSAYPLPNMDEADMIWDAVDERTEYLRKKRIDQGKEYQ